MLFVYLVLTFSCLQPVGYHLPWNCTAQDEDYKEVLSYSLAPTVDSQYFTLDTSHGCALALARVIDSEDPAAPESVILSKVFVHYYTPKKGAHIFNDIYLASNQIFFFIRLQYFCLEHTYS